jgi:phage terminase large subunit-like protein
MEFFKKEQIDAFSPGSQKVIGLDIAYAGDRYGLTMIHIHDTVGEGELQEYQYWVDFAVGIVPPKGEQLKLYQIREFVVQLHKMGVGVELVVSDSFQSKESLQLLEQQGISTKMYSVDRKKEAYYALRDAITSDRIKMPNNKILYRELVFLKEDEKKIDHPVTNPDGTRGSKDIADAIANALWNITHEIEYKPYLNQDFIKELDEEVSDDFDESDPFGHIFGEGVEGSWVT